MRDIIAALLLLPALCASEAALRWRRLSVVHSGEPLLHEIANIEAAPGRLLGVLGPSGAGKTTLLRALAGALEAGRTQVYGEPEGAATPSMADGSVAFLAQADSSARVGGRAVGLLGLGVWAWGALFVPSCKWLSTCRLRSARRSEPHLLR